MVLPSIDLNLLFRHHPLSTWGFVAVLVIVGSVVLGRAYLKFRTRTAPGNSADRVELEKQRLEYRFAKGQLRLQARRDRHERLRDWVNLFLHWRAGGRPPQEPGQAQLPPGNVPPS